MIQSWIQNPVSPDPSDRMPTRLYLDRVRVRLGVTTAKVRIAYLEILFAEFAEQCDTTPLFCKQKSLAPSAVNLAESSSQKRSSNPNRALQERNSFLVCLEQVIILFYCKSINGIRKEEP